MALHWPTFLTRAGSAVVFGIIMITGLLWNEWSFFVLVLLIQVLCMREFFKLAEKIAGFQFSQWQRLGFTLFGVAILIAVQSHVNAESGITQLPGEGGWHFAIGARVYPLWGALLFLPTLILLFGALSKKNHLFQSIWGMGSIFYIIMPTAMLLYMREFDWVWPLALILMIWMNDTMAYIVGSLIGKTPFSQISPKKTWEGTLGGALLTILGAVIWGFFAEKRLIIDAAVLALCAAGAGTAGDLLESRMKRMADVKDSGTMMPGHGGALDRFDSLLVATPFAFSWLYVSYVLMAS